MIIFNNVSKRYASGQEALSAVNFHLERGEMAFLTGHSGAGKSTLLKLIAVMERPSIGEVMIDGRNVAKLRARQIPQVRRSMGVIFQNPMLLNERTIFDNVALPLVITGLRHQEISRRVHAALDQVNLLHKRKRYPMMLSGGEQQRIGIARAIVHKPALLLADEPTGNLDPGLSAEIMHLFERFNKVGVSVLIASHDLGLIATMGYRTLVLKQGRLS